VAEERLLIATKNRNIEIVVPTSFTPEEEIERPTSTDPPGRPQSVEKGSEVGRFEYFPGPEVGVVAQLH
jgi:hypothetical protein